MLDETKHEKFLRLYAQHERGIRAFVASLLPTWAGVDEVVQESCLVMWRKFNQFEADGPAAGFRDWAFKIIRFEVLAYRRRCATDRLRFADDLHELLATEAEDVAATQLARERALQECLRKLQPGQCELIRLAYVEGTSIKDIAKAMGRTPTALYKALARIRDGLHDCVQRSLASGGAEKGEKQASEF